MQRRAHPSILPAGRQRRIMDALRSEGAVTVESLVPLLGVSESTVLRDLELLSERGLLSRTHGGAVLPSLSTAFENAYADKTKAFVEEKARIGSRAASLVADGDTLILDAGSTTLEIARVRRVLLIARRHPGPASDHEVEEDSSGSDEHADESRDEADEETMPPKQGPEGFEALQAWRLSVHRFVTTRSDSTSTSNPQTRE